MKNHFIFIVGLILLIVTIWATTMIGLKYNNDNKNKKYFVPIYNIAQDFSNDF